PLAAPAIRQFVHAESGHEARERLGDVLERLAPIAPKVVRLLEDAAEDLLGFYAFPPEHWTKLRSTNPLERVNKEIGRRSDVVGIFPNDASGDPARRRAADRAERRVAGLPPLPVGRVDGADPPRRRPRARRAPPATRRRALPVTPRDPT